MGKTRVHREASDNLTNLEAFAYDTHFKRPIEELAEFVVRHERAEQLVLQLQSARLTALNCKLCSVATSTALSRYRNAAQQRELASLERDRGDLLRSGHEASTDAGTSLEQYTHELQVLTDADEPTDEQVARTDELRSTVARLKRALASFEAAREEYGKAASVEELKRSSARFRDSLRALSRSAAADIEAEIATERPDADRRAPSAGLRLPALVQ